MRIATTAGAALLLYAPLLPARVAIMEAIYEGAPHFVVTTSTATYWYDRSGGGLSRLMDRDGRDWIAFRREPWNQVPASAASSFRGIPNFVFGGAESGAGHPGFTQCISERTDSSIMSSTRSGQWRWTWTFFDTHARVRMEKTGDSGYWFLYEGVPGGQYAPAAWYWGDADGGPRHDMPDHLAGGRSIALRRWIYFGSDRSPRVLFLAQHEEDEIPDALSVMGSRRNGLFAPDGMTVFGFGRARDAKGLLQKPLTFTIGLLEGKVTTLRQHRRLAARLDAIANPQAAHLSPSMVVDP